jgi:ribosomal protein S18 acetylase RimI-like enzyme
VNEYQPVHYTESLAGIDASQLAGGFFIGWPNPPSPETHLRLLQGSSHVVLAIDERTADVVGFATAISDGVLSAYIPLLEVLPEYQHQGIGQELMRRMIAALRSLYMVDLLCDPELQPFYEQTGMRRAVGMLIRNFDRQHGSN